MARRSRLVTSNANEADKTSIPKAGASGGSELDEYINLGAAEEDTDEVLDELIGEMGGKEEEEEQEAAPPTKLEKDEEIEEIEKEKSVPVEKLLDDVAPEYSQTLDPVRMYLRDIGLHALLTAEQELDFASTIVQGREAQERLDAADAGAKAAESEEEGAKAPESVEEGAKAAESAESVEE